LNTIAAEYQRLKRVRKQGKEAGKEPGIPQQKKLLMMSEA
jgi:hypothetical protein